MQAKMKEVREKALALLRQSEQLYGIKVPEVEIRFDLKGRAAGMAGYKGAYFYMRFNLGMMMTEAWDHIIDDTVPHEVAHIVCYVNPSLGRRHDHGWKRVCAQLGGSAKRTHSELVLYAKGKTFRYVSTENHTVHLSANMHESIQRGRTYHTKAKGMFDKSCQFALVGVNGKPVANVPAVTATPIVPRTTPVVLPANRPASVAYKPASVSRATSGTTNADKIRARIREAKAAGHGPDVVIQYGVDVLKQKRALAASYVKNNWPKVV